VQVDETEMTALAALRRERLDPLLPAHVGTQPGCGALFIATGPDGQPTAIARCEHWTGEPGTMELLWGASRRFTLVPQFAGPDVAAALSELLTQWHDHLAELPEADGPDAAALINWPSRDVAGVLTLVRHGLVPFDVIAIRDDRRATVARPAGTAPIDTTPADAAGLQLRQAGPADLDVVAEFEYAEVQFDAHFGGVVDRPFALDALRDYLRVQLSEPDPWTWLAERDGSVLGMLTAERPAATAWIAPFTSRSPISYLMSAFVRPAERGSGAGRLLTQQFHHCSAAAGIRTSLLHYEALNPLSGPFWSKQGYRPLWTVFTATPARVLRRLPLR
jgi:GNAT superfamily N-acetyltransferase